MNLRRSARVAALRALYQAEILGDYSRDRLQSFWEGFPERAQVRTYANRLLLGLIPNLPLVDQWIERAADNWRLDRMSVIDRNLLRLAIYELLFMDEVPPKVSINEAVEIAKQYSGEQSCSFINGILDRVLRDSAREPEGGSVSAGA